MKINQKKKKKEKNADEQMAIPERGEISKFLVQKKKNKTGKSGNTALNFSLANLFLAFAFFFGSILIVGAP